MTFTILGKTAKQLLAKLKKEREKYTEQDKTVMQELVDQLVKIGEYPVSTPVMREHKYTHLQMVEAWGEDWHQFKGVLNCPHCKSDLRSKEGPPFKREIGIYSQERDCTTHFICPDCEKVIPRA